MEYGAQVYGPLMNQSQSDEIEAVQVKALQIVMGENSRSYARNLAALSMETLEIRRQGLVRSFAISTFRAPEHRWWYTPSSPSPYQTSSSSLLSPLL